jgi:phosphoesterase RecJ-like protein
MSELIKHLKDESILITGHINPDGDALGSALALKLIFQSKGIESDVYFDKTTKFPNTLNHLPLYFINEEIKEKYDTVYVFDCGSSSRLGIVEKVALESNKVVVVDHHINPTFGDIQIIDSNAASTTQVLYRELVNVKELISKEVANCLMTGLITDTGRFQYSNTTSEVLSIAASLVDFGAEISVISENIYGTKNLNAMNLESEVVNRINVLDEEKLVFSYVLQEDYSKFNIDESEMDFLIDSIRLVEGTNVALLLKEQKDGSYKGSLRSRSLIDVQKVASSFNGGGHKAASGFSSSLNQDEIVNQVKNEIRTQL